MSYCLRVSERLAYGDRTASLLLQTTLVVVLLTSTAMAVDPQLRSIAPRGGQRGTEVEVRLTGTRLADAEELLLYEPGIKVVGLEKEEKNANAVKARLAIADDCRLGPHALRLRTATGISELLTFSVGALPEVAETEPNSEFTTPQQITLGTTVAGVVEDEDVDYYLLEAKAGERICVEVEGLRLGAAFFDPYVAILDRDRFVLASADDTPLVHQDAVCSIIAPSDDSYVIEVRESAYEGSSQCHYRLHVGRFPRPLTVYPAGGRPGESLEVRWLGDVAGERTEQLKLPEGPPGIVGIFAQDEKGTSPSPNLVRLADLDNVLEIEPNPSADEATPFTAPAALNGILSEPGDVDCFKFSAKKGEVYEVRVYGRSVRSPIDSVLSIRQIGGGNVASNDDERAGEPDSYVRFRAPADAEYQVTLRDQLGRGGPEFVYRIEFSPVTPGLTLSLPERARYTDIVAAVPQGNRTAMMVNAQRDGFGGPIDLEFKDLPPGVTIETLPIADGEIAVPVLFTAAADAKPAGALVGVLGHHAGDNRSIDGRLQQQTALIRGQNNRGVWEYEADRMAVAVTQPAPFSIDIVQPKAPLVRSGSMQLKVVARRQEGFTAPIAVRTLYDPSGVSSSASIRITEGQTEATIPVTASGGAKLGTWKIAVLGQATVDGGAMVVSSQLADLEVTEPYFNFTFAGAAVEQGQGGQLVIAVEKTKDFEGAAKLELLGLPAEVTSEPQEITAKSADVTFPIATTEKSPVGRHKSIRCRAVVMVNDEPVTHLLGPGELRINRPPPPKTDEPPKAKPEPRPEATAPAEKPLSRLEQLRLERAKAKKTDKE